MDYLVEHAIENVWCSPRQDRQFITRPKRVSQPGGELIQIELDWLQVYLPDNKHYYYVYQVGQIHPDFLGLFPVQNEWVSLTDVCNKMGMIAECYTTRGVQLPKFETYYMVTSARNLIIATKKENDLLGINLSEEDLWFRVYTNAFWESDRSHSLTEKIITKGKSPELMTDILAMQMEFNEQRAKPIGYAYAIINGYYAEEISPLTCKVGDLVEWIYDASVKKVVEYQIDFLPNFDSILDNERKYLLHYADVDNIIEYQDDVDLFLVQRDPGVKPNGLYHHKNTAAALRMVTHKDYSMSVQLINAFVDGHPKWTDPQKLRVMAIIRHAGYDRPLVFENNRIHELYKLPDADILPAMIGDNATVPNWQAAELENAAYTKIMRSKYDEVTRPLVQQAYGYNAMSKILGDTPMKVYASQGVNMVDMPRGLYENATCYEYDANGLLLGWYYHDQGTQYVTNNTGCKLVEAISGRVSRTLDEVYDTQMQTLDPKLNYRMYICDKIGGVLQNNWRDVTESGMYAVVNNKLTWVINMTNYSTLVRSDKNALGYMFNLNSRSGLLEFNLSKYVTRGGVTALQKVDVHQGEYDIWLNARSLTEMTDYIIKDSKVIIFNKKYLLNPEVQNQQVVVRSTGFCKQDMTRELVEDRGFVKWELLSRNSVFNIRDDRVMRIVVDGRTYHRDSLQFSEKDQMYTLPNAQNGEPYAIRDMVVPMRSMTDGDTYSLREESRAIDKLVSDYLSAKLPEPDPTVPNVINSKYPVFTPFLCKIMFDLIDGVIDIEQLKVQYDATLVKKICAPYEYILAFDPTQTANLQDPNYVTINPHHYTYFVDVDIYHFKFLEHVIAIYMKGKTSLNDFVRLKQITG